MQQRSAMYKLEHGAYYFDNNGNSLAAVGVLALEVDKEYPLYPWLLTPYRDLPKRHRCVAKRGYTMEVTKGEVCD
jgi:hypothetical protein